MKIRYILILGIAFLGNLLTSCTEDVFLDQTPQASLNEAIYFTTPAQFTAAANNIHTNVYTYDYGISFDWGSDISSLQNAEGSGTNVAGTTDAYWDKAYTWLRTVNVYLSKYKAYSGDKSTIAGPTGQAYFFRAWHHFFLLKRFGGVPIATYVPDINSDLLTSTRASRYQVMDQIVNDLDSAILLLNTAAVTKASTNNDGHVTLEAARAFKARVCLFEGTWEKYVGTTTDGDGTINGAGSAGYDAANSVKYLTMARDLAKGFIDGVDKGKFSLWNGVSSVTSASVANKAMYANTSYFYLFNLEDAGSNPNGLTKASNNEAIFREVYDFTYRKANVNLTHTAPAAQSRKLVDMYLCSDGLPIQYSPLFQGYGSMTSEFVNRDYRLTSLSRIPKAWYWGWLMYNTGAQYAVDITTLSSITYQNWPSLTGGGGYGSRKYCTENPARTDNAESADYMFIRMSEMYLIFAEAQAELNGGDLSDADLDISINKIRDRAGVAHLSHALIAPYAGLTILGEIRRERALELQAEGQRISDLCRWGIAEQELAAKPTCGVYLTYGGVNTEYSTAINPNSKKSILTAGSYSASTITQTDIPTSSYAGISTTKAGAVITEQASGRKFGRKNYLQPIGTSQIDLNHNLKQNPSW